MKINVGIIGGMGPMATVEFLRTLTEITDGEIDQDHLNYILYSMPEIPSRIDAYYHGKETPVRAINEGIEFLLKNNVDTIAIPCNTAHIWFEQFEHSDKILNMIELTAKKIVSSGYKRPAILATTATLDSRLYIDELKSSGIDVIIPEDEDSVMEAVQLVKRDKIKEGHELLMPVIQSFEKLKCDSIILACTEIPVILSEQDTKLPLINSDAVLAEAIITAGGKKVKKTL